jgi:hypothetical protein
MRRITFLLLVLSLTISNDLFSQKMFEIGFYVGTSVTSMSGVDYLAEELTNALTIAAGKEFPVSKGPRSFLLNGGAFVIYNFSKSFALKGGIEYAPKGVNFNGECYLSTNIYTMSSDVIILSSTLNMAYIEFPISVQLSTRSNEKPDKIYVYFNLGMAPALKIRSKQEVSVRMVERGFDNSGVTEEPIGETQFDTQELEGINGFDYGVFFSTGVSGGKFFNRWFLDLKYERGVKNILENANAGDVKNNMFALCMGFKF